MHFESERTSLERRQNKTREWRGGTRKDPQLTSRLRPPIFRPGDLLVQKDHSYVHSRNSLPSPLSAYHPFLRASSAVRVFKGRTKATGNCCRLFRRYGRFYICPSLDRSSLSLPFLCSVLICLSFFSLYLSSSFSTIDNFTSRYLPRRQEFR